MQNNMDRKDFIIKLLCERLEMINKMLKYDLRNYEREIIERDLMEIIHTLDDEKDLREEWLNMK